MLARTKFEQYARGETRVSLSVLSKSEVRALDVNLSRSAAPVANLSVATNSKKFGRHDDLFKEKSGFGWLPGPTNFTKLARQRVADAAAVLEDLYGADVIFTTLTLTGQTDESKLQLSKYSGFIIQCLKQFLHDNAPDAMTVGVWERQKNGALHLHLVTGCRDTIQRETIEKSVCAYWIHLEKVVSLRSGVNLFINAKGENLELRPEVWRNESVRVRKSVRRYVSKYTSKQKIERNNRGTIRGIKQYFPSRWWFIDNKLRAIVVERNYRVVSEAKSFTQADEEISRLLGEVISLAKKVVFYRNPERHHDITFVLFHDDVHDLAFARAIAEKHVCTWKLKTQTKDPADSLSYGSFVVKQQEVLRSRYSVSRWSQYLKMVS